MNILQESPTLKSMTLLPYLWLDSTLSAPLAHKHSWPKILRGPARSLLHPTRPQLQFLRYCWMNSASGNLSQKLTSYVGWELSIYIFIRWILNNYRKFYLKSLISVGFSLDILRTKFNVALISLVLSDIFRLFEFIALLF